MSTSSPCRRKVKSPNFNIFHPLEVAYVLVPGAQFPKYPQAAETKLQHIYYPFLKGHVSSIVRACQILGAVCEYKLQHKKSVKGAFSQIHSKYLAPDYYMQCSLEELCTFVFTTSSYHLSYTDLPDVARNWTSIDWLLRAMKFVFDRDITPEDAVILLRENIHLRSVIQSFPSAIAPLFLNEECSVGEYATNLQLSPATAEEQRQFLATHERKQLQKSDPFDKFSMSIPPQVLDTYPRQQCSICNKKVHLYCPTCLAWAVNLDTLKTILSQATPPIVCPSHLADLFQPHHTSDPALPSFSKYTSHNIHDVVYAHYTDVAHGLTGDACTPLIKPVGIPLPVSIELVHHPGEKITKSTGLHSCLLSPQQARLVPLDDVPQYSAEDTVILFPTEDSLDSSEIDWSSVRHCVVIEATWQGTTRALAHPHLQGLKRARLGSYETMFWRNQHQGPEFLATLEAIYYLCREIHSAMLQKGMLSPSTLPLLTHQSSLSVEPAKMETTGEAEQQADTLDDLFLLYATRLSRVLSTYESDVNQAKQPKSWKHAQGQGAEEIVKTKQTCYASNHQPAPQ